MLQLRYGTLSDLATIMDLAINEWSQFKPLLTKQHWQSLYTSITDKETYTKLFAMAKCFVCEYNNVLAGFGFWVPSGNATEIYSAQQSYIRFVTVSKTYSGQGIGRLITQRCIEEAISNNESSIALHTSEMMQAAMHIYQKLGFAKVRTLEPRLGKQYWLYELQL